jgi:hypothetical protein
MAQNNLTGNIGHIVTAIVVIAAAVVLALHGNISGESALVVIGAAGGFSLGGSVASSPSTTPPAKVVTPTASTSAWTSTLSPSTPTTEGGASL